MRNISKLPNIPALNEEIVRIVTAMLFVNNELSIEPNTLLQIMGNVAFLPDMIKGFPIKYYENVLVSGGKNPYYKEDNNEVDFVEMLYTANGNDWNDVFVKSEAEIIKNEFDKNGVETAHWKLEKKSTNTKENFKASKKAGFYKGVDNLVIYTTNESMVRAKLTAESMLKNAKVSVVGYTPTVSSMGIKVDFDNWAKNPLSVKYVWGEILRLKQYSDKKDFKLDAQTANLMNRLLKAHQK